MFVCMYVCTVCMYVHKYQYINTCIVVSIISSWLFSDGLVNAYRYWCDCSGTGFYGDKCENETNECDSSPCQHNATCVDLIAVC